MLLQSHHKWYNAESAHSSYRKNPTSHANLQLTSKTVFLHWSTPTDEWWPQRDPSFYTPAILAFLCTTTRIWSICLITTVHPNESLWTPPPRCPSPIAAGPTARWILWVRTCFFRRSLIATSTVGWVCNARGIGWLHWWCDYIYLRRCPPILCLSCDVPPSFPTGQWLHKPYKYCALRSGHSALAAISASKEKDPVCPCTSHY